MIHPALSSGKSRPGSLWLSRGSWPATRVRIPRRLYRTFVLYNLPQRHQKINLPKTQHFAQKLADLATFGPVLKAVFGGIISTLKSVFFGRNNSLLFIVHQPLYQL
jgi:hypothetical protein